MNKILTLVVFSILLSIPVGAQNAFGHGTPDQTNAGPSTGSHPIHFALPSGTESQSFQPSSSPLAGFDVELINPTDSQVVITTLAWGVTDLDSLDVQGNLANVILDPGLNTVHIDLPTPAVVNTGANHAIQIAGSFGDETPTVIEWTYTGNNYPNGVSAIDGVPDLSKDFIFTTYSGTPESEPEPISCGPKTMINDQNQCVPDLNQICGSGTIPDFNTIMCIATTMGTMVGGTLLDIDTYALLAAAVGVNPVITGLVAITLAGVIGQIVWFIHKKKNS